MYVTTVAVMYGFWFTHTDATQVPVHRPPVDAFFVVGITVVTFASSLLMAMHNLVMRRLTSFMKNCEEYAEASIASRGKDGKNSLFYFRDPSKNKVDDFHTSQRWRHRGVLALIIFAAHASAIYLTWGLSDQGIDAKVSVACVVVLVLSLVVLLLFDSWDGAAAL